MKQIALLSIIILRIAAIDLYSQDVNYQDLALSQGIDHTFSNNTNGSGVSFVDFDGDGLDDITLGTNEDDVIHFYKNMRIFLNIVKNHHKWYRIYYCHLFFYLKILIWSQISVN